MIGNRIYNILSLLNDNIMAYIVVYLKKYVIETFGVGRNIII